MIETPYKGNATIQREGNALNIFMPAYEKNVFTIIFLSVWLTGWVVGEVITIGAIINDSDAGFPPQLNVLWLTGWTIGGVFASWNLLWILLGRETVNIAAGEITITKTLFSFGSRKTYRISDIKHIVLAKRWEDERVRKRQLLKSGLIEFDYGLKTINFASGVDLAEARHLIELFKKNSNFNEDNFSGVGSISS